MSRNNPPAPAPAMDVAVASTGCTGLLSSFLRRRVPQQPLAPPPPRRDAKAAERLQVLKAQVDRLRLRLLEEEFEALNKLHQEHEAAEKETIMPVLRLEDGSYLREVSRAGGGPWERLAVQVSRSRPVVTHADAASASEVLDKMAAMGADDLCRYLNKYMPLKDIAGQNSPGEPVQRTTAGLSSDDDDDGGGGGGLVLEAMGKLESLVLEGLKIQATEPAAAAVVGRRRERGEAVDNDDGNGCCRVHVVLMQARDPTEMYAAVGDRMIGLVEAASASLDPGRKDATATARRRVLGLHVAGIKFVDGRRVMWSAYLRQCKESHDGDGCRCTCVRNPNRVFQR